ncbi:MAG TPA: hypothetical protein VFC51_18845 [Chloroflexota bacterium]|nr:hypothetical protein [Chloroflexota bacterium]
MHGESSVRRPAGYPWHMPAGWWLKNGDYIRYMIREVTAVFAALWVVAFLVQLAGNGRNPAAWAATFRSPGWLVFSIIALAFVLYHAWTAFTATGTLVHLRMGKQVVPSGQLNGVMFVGWAVATIVIGAILLMG